MFENLLKYCFLAIFTATAILGIGSLPDWIKIQEWYKKKIFIALILEVVGAVIILFNSLNDSNLKPVLFDEIRNEKWMAVNENAQFVTPDIELNDSTRTVTLKNNLFSQFKNLRLTPGKGKFEIINNDSSTIGEIPEDNIVQLGLFNKIEADKSDISSSKNYSYISWEKDSVNNEWISQGESDSPFELIVYDDTNRTKYKIIDTQTKEIKFSSDNKAVQLFDENNRINHFFSRDNKYYLIRIAFADLRDNNNNFVRVIYLRINPILDI